ncbi:putative integrase core domain protein [Rhizophagus irregularis DAOM 181602=DAOM 197198]|nr:putative integrase core domain protein [Rhizophagus irregularis DAOM 181602=DAOM 197198]
MDTDTYYRLIRYLDDLTLPADFDTTQLRNFKNKARSYIIKNGILYRRNIRNPQRPMRVIKKNEMEIILRGFHDDPLAGHFGFNETFRAIKEKYFWPQMGDDIKAYVQACDTCQRRKRPIKTEPLHPIKVGQPFDRIGMDIVGPLPLTKKGNQYIVVATEYLTKWPEARALPDAKATSVVSFFYEDIVCRHGCPKELLTDQGTHFVNEMLDSLCKRLGITHRLSVAYHPQTNGLVERFNRTLCELLAKYCIERKDDWDLFIPSALFAYRTMRQNTTRYEPFYLTYGRDAVLPIELEVPTYPFEDRSDRGFEDLYFRRLGQLAGNLIDDRQQANENIQHAQKRQVERHNKQIKEHRYQIGEKVLLRNFRAKKLDSKWHGPYYIHDVRPNGTYKLRTLEGKLRKKVVHADQIRSYYERTITN